MAQKQKKKAKAKTKVEVLDLDPDAWPKFEKLIKNAAKMGPKPHVSKKAKRA
jgi:uncharacterized protein HemY